MNPRLLNHDDNSKLFLGIVNQRYIKTFYGLIHGIGSMVALILGNYVFVDRVVLGSIGSSNLKIETMFHACNLGSSIITALFFWDKVQAFKLSTTSVKDQGMTPENVQRGNQGRGVVSMIIFSAFPLAHLCLSQNLLDDVIFSKVFAILMVAGSVKIYHLMKDFGKVLWLVYGMTPMALGISLLSSGEETMGSLHQKYPSVLDNLHKESSFVICCVQMGFMLYYFYSRNLVTKLTVQKICKIYHLSITLAFMFRIERDLWLHFSTSSNESLLPVPMLVQPLVLSFALNVKLLSLVLKKLFEMFKSVTKELHMPARRSVSLSTTQRRLSKTTSRRRSVSARVGAACQ